jgi:hypothetical protein
VAGFDLGFETIGCLVNHRLRENHQHARKPLSAAVKRGARSEKFALDDQAGLN